MEAGNTDVERILLAHGAKRPVMSYDEFMKLSQSGEAEKVEEAIRNGVSPNTRRNDLDTTALYYAAAYGHADVAEILLKHGADVNAEDWGITALHGAAYEGHADVVEVLLKYGADINAKDGDGDTALDVAISKGHAEVARVLRAHGAKLPAMSDDEFMELCKSGKTEEVEAALKDGANPNAKGKYGHAVLYRAVSSRRAPIVELLLQYGADVNAKDMDGETALYRAAYEGYSDVVEILL